MFRKLLLVVSCVGVVAGCSSPQVKPYRSWPLSKQIEYQLASRKISLVEMESYRQTQIKRAETELEIAKINAQTQNIKSLAAAEENKLIEASIQNKELLRNWKPATSASVFETNFTLSYSTSGTYICCKYNTVCSQASVRAFTNGCN